MTHRIHPNSSVFLTGSTGLIGGELALTIGKFTQNLNCLVRPNPKSPHSASDSAKERLNQRLRQYSYSNIDRTSSIVPNLNAVAGDLREKDLGLNESNFNSLRESVEIIIHCAAETSFLQSDSCQKTNIEGTQRLLEFAAQCKKKPLIVYISTACNSGKISSVCLSEDQGCQPENDHHNDYTRSKAIAEKLVQNCGLESLIIRPSIVLGDQIRNATFAQQILWFCPLMTEFEALPLDPNARIDIVSTSFVASALYQLLAKPDRKHTAYHLSAGQSSLQVQEWNDFLNRYYKRRNPLRLIHPSEWGQREFLHFVKTNLQRKIFFAMRYYFPFINMNVIFDHSRLKSELGELVIPPVTSYLGDILNQIRWKEALLESQAP